jgi:endonuclease/exonuclease/phosphatase family metal-dependent hydrolase
MNAKSLKLVNLNIEGDKHLDRVVPFLKSQNSDVICLQEALDKDVESLKRELQMEGSYFPTVFMPEGNRGGITPGTQWGILVLYTQSPLSIISHHYVQHSETLPIFTNENVNSTNRVLVGIECQKAGTVYRVFTTHFTWTPTGEPDQLQRENLNSLFKILDNYDELVLCGDFNAPRGKEIWDTIAQKYTDNIPSDITTTIDQNLHKAGDLQLVVDGMFSTPRYEVRDMEIVDGLSDHMAIVAHISRA